MCIRDRLTDELGPFKDGAFRLALEAGMHDVTRLRRLLERGPCPDEPRTPAKVVPIARYLRPRDHFALRRER